MLTCTHVCYTGIVTSSCPPFLNDSLIEFAFCSALGPGGLESGAGPTCTVIFGL